ncbi:hypothetical protein [Pseudomonas segetis]|uniref:Uncharacterized protein n=1 Tax=Pseudomonas segetis TaxID=298908 RepID=A0A238ZPY6_9PSED|nr:hypothetical protein [Pseudomonas segetis]SNR85249.1 hypothetical protein SAMN05216255_0595 [Pseudomonas segetis]
MQKIDLSISGNMRTLAQLSFAFGIPGGIFVLKYFYDYYGEGIKIPAVFYMLPVGVVLLFLALIFSPAAYKTKLPEINSSIASWLNIVKRYPDHPSLYRTKILIFALQVQRLVIISSFPGLLILLLVSTAHYLATY